MIQGPSWFYLSSLVASQPFMYGRSSATSILVSFAPSARSPRYLKIAAVLAVIAVLVIAQRFGVFKQLEEPRHLASTLVALGVWGYVAFVVAYALFQPFGVPGTVFVVAAALIWPWPLAFALSIVGTMSASVVGFSFARFVARDWIAGRLPARFKKYDEALAARAFATVFFLRLVFWMPPLLHAFFGVSKVRFWTHFSASFAGYLLPLFVLCYFGQKAFDALTHAPTGWWIGLGIGVALLAAAAWGVRRRMARGAEPVVGE